MDLNLIWENCKVYNMVGCEIYNSALHLQQKTFKLMEKHFKSIFTFILKYLNDKQVHNPLDIQKEAVKEFQLKGGNYKEKLFNDLYFLKALDLNFITPEEVISISQLMERLSQEKLKRFLAYLSKEVPTIYEEYQEDKVIVHFELLTKDVYNKVKLFINNLK